MKIPTTPHFLVLLEKSEQYNRLEYHFAGHIAFIEELITKDKVFIGGDIISSSEKGRQMFDEFDSAYLLKVKTLDEATEIANRDPFSINMVYKPLVIQWNLIDE